MKKLVILLIAFPFILNGQQLLPELMTTSLSSSEYQAEQQINSFVQHLKTKKHGSDVWLLKKAFHQTQRNFLSSYSPYSEFSELFSSGKFDCLTATSLFSIVLDRLHFKYHIIETNYHIFLIVNTSKGDVLLETTDRFAGFIQNKKEIQQRISSYRESASTTGGNEEIYRYHFNLYDEVNPNQLPGLLYFNQAVKAFNNGSFERCGTLLVKAKSIYDTPRISEFSSIFLQTVATSKLDDQTKQRILVQFKNLKVQKSAILASR